MYKPGKTECLSKGLKNGMKKKKSMNSMRFFLFADHIFAKYVFSRKSVQFPLLVFLKAFSPFYVIRKIKIHFIESIIIKPRICINPFFGITNRFLRVLNAITQSIKPLYLRTFIHSKPGTEHHYARDFPGLKQFPFPLSPHEPFITFHRGIPKEKIFSENVFSVLSLFSIINNPQNKLEYTSPFTPNPSGTGKNIVLMNLRNQLTGGTAEPALKSGNTYNTHPVDTINPIVQTHTPVSRAVIMKHRHIHRSILKPVTKEITRLSFIPVIRQNPAVFTNQIINREKSGEPVKYTLPFAGVYSPEKIPAFFPAEKQTGILSAGEDFKTTLPTYWKTQPWNQEKTSDTSFTPGKHSTGIYSQKQASFFILRGRKMNTIRQKIHMRNISATIFSKYHYAVPGNTEIQRAVLMKNVQGSMGPEMVISGKNIFKQRTVHTTEELVYKNPSVHESKVRLSEQDTRVNEKSLPLQTGDSLKDFPEKTLKRHITRVADRVYRIIERRIKIERERRGLDWQ